MLFQVYTNITNEQLSSLNVYGVQILDYAGANTYIVSMPANCSTEDMPAESGLRWMGEIPVENKYDKLFGLNAPEWAWDEDGHVEILLIFYDDVTYEEAQNIARKYSTTSLEFVTFPSLTFTIKTHESNISVIATEDLIESLAFPEGELVDEESSPGFQFLMILCAMLYYKKN